MHTRLLSFGLCLAAHVTFAQTVELIPYVQGISGIVDIAHAGDARIFCVTQSGTIRIVQDDELLPTPFLDITDRVHSLGWEQGLLGLAFDPGYAQNGRFYVHYTAAGQWGTTRVSRFHVSVDDPNMADPDEEEILFTYPQPATNHNGGDLAFGPDGHLYISLGDGGLNQNGQNKTNPLGAILRIDVSGEAGYVVPPDNPFADGAGGAAPEIFAYGLRNPWRMGFDALTGDLWLGDVGAFSWEEINFWPAGDLGGPNFGWSCMEGFVVPPGPICAPNPSFVDPVAVHPTSGSWCSIIGGRVYRGSEHPALQGKYIYSDYCNGEFHALEPDGEDGWTGSMMAATGLSGIACIGEDHQLELYAGNRNNGTLYRIVDPLSVRVVEEERKSSTIHPVPADDRLFIRPNSATGISHVDLFDASGRHSGRFIAPGIASTMELGVGHLAPGAYTLVLYGDQGGPPFRHPIIIAR
jgi:glucose/arabinose dehydrogenase